MSDHYMYNVMAQAMSDALDFSRMFKNEGIPQFVIRTDEHQHYITDCMVDGLEVIAVAISGKLFTPN